MGALLDPRRRAPAEMQNALHMFDGGKRPRFLLKSGALKAVFDAAPGAVGE